MNRKNIEKEIDEIIERSEKILFLFARDCGSEKDKQRFYAHKESENIFYKDHIFSEEYQKWYTKCILILKLVLPERLDEFVSCYLPDKKRKTVDVETYTISDAINGYQKGYFGIYPSTCFSKLCIQTEMIKSIKPIFVNKLDNIKSIVEFDVFEKEIDAASMLLSKGYLRSAGAICGVILESYLLEIATKNNIKLSKKTNSINELNQLLYENGQFDSTNFKFIQYLADIRNKCDHDKLSEPTKEEVQKLINGTKDVISTY